jgi:predicted GNAT family acetyltransferase
MISILTNNAKASRYELAVDGHIVYADYGRDGDILTIKYVYAPPELRGTGAAGRFMEALMELARAEKLKVIPVCGYAATWIQRHEDYHGLLA